MPPAKLPVENKQSILLTNEENQHIVRLLGVRCQTLCTCVVQLYNTQPPNHAQWTKKDTGVLCFIKDNMRKNYFFRVYCFKRNHLVWEQEMYNNMEYTATMPYLHTFEGEDCLFAFNFADVNEARDMKNVVDSKIMAKRKKEERRLKSNSILLDEQPKMKAVNTDLPLRPKYADAEMKKAKRKRNITKADIGTPSEFRHISHVGWDPDKGFDVNTEDAQFADFFKKAGVSETELRDTETRKFIYEFIAANGVREAVATEQKQTRRPPPAIPTSNANNTSSAVPPAAIGPPVPPRGTNRSSHSRVAPPPPPSSIAPQRPPPTNPRIIHHVNDKGEESTIEPKPEINILPSSFNYNNSNIVISGNNSGGIPPPPSGNAPPPPPPPPLPAFDVPPSPPMINKMEHSNNSLQQSGNGGDNMRSALMESIRSGTTLRPVEEKKCNTIEDPRGDLLSEIRKGFQLKPCNERDIKPVSPSSDTASDLAGALARALAERNRFIHSEDDSTSDTESENDDDWDA